MPAAGSQSWWKRKVWKLPVWAWILIAMVIIGAAASSSNKDKAKDASDTTVAATAIDAASGDTGAPESAATTTDVPATASADATIPTPTGAPTTTVAPTTVATTTLAPTTTVPAPPVLLQGRGDSVVALPDQEAYVAEITHNGTSNFAVATLDSSLNQTDLLVNEIGGFLGRVGVNFDGDSTNLEITADGDWTVTLIPLVQGAHLLGTTLSGTGKDVLFVNDTAVYTVTHDGTSNFAVIIYTKSGRDLLVNEIGAYSGSVPVRGPGFITVEADGNWSFTTN